MFIQVNHYQIYTISYVLLPHRLIKTTLLYGFVGAIISTAAFGTEVSLPYLLGAGAGAFYLYLLGKRTDRIGAGYAVESKNSTEISVAEEKQTFKFVRIKCYTT